MRIEGGVRHCVARQTGLAVAVAIAGDEAAKPTQIAAAAPRVTGIARLDRTVGARQRARHQELRIFRQEEHQADTDDRRECKQYSQTIAPRVGACAALDLPRPNKLDPSWSPHQKAVAEKA
jgi:hypothetical protein